MDVAALIISILSLLISIVFAVAEIKNSKKINDINLDAELSRDIIKLYLTEKFPVAISKIHFPKQKLTQIGPLQVELNGLRNSLKFFKYYDNSFYKELKKKTQDLEDYIVQNEGKKYSVDEQGEVMDEIRNRMSDIYKCLNKKYKNG